MKNATRRVPPTKARDRLAYAAVFCSLQLLIAMQKIKIIIIGKACLERRAQAKPDAQWLGDKMEEQTMASSGSSFPGIVC
jgi:hypothetical protein